MENINKEGYSPIFFKKKKRITNPLQRRKNRQRYLKNKSKIKLYNKKWRKRNKMVLKHRQRMKRLFRRK